MSTLGGIPVTITNNWGVNTYHVGDEVLTEGDCSVLFPDGVITRVTIVGRPRTVRVPDMGHTYETKTIDLGFEADFRGIPVWIDATKIKIWSWI